jgi:hypothetical protein
MQSHFLVAFSTNSDKRFKGKAANVLNEIAGELEEGSKLKVGRVDCEFDHFLCERLFPVIEVPSLILFKDNQAFKYPMGFSIEDKEDIL